MFGVNGSCPFVGFVKLNIAVSVVSPPSDNINLVKKEFGVYEIGWGDAIVRNKINTAKMLVAKTIALILDAAFITFTWKN